MQLPLLEASELARLAPRAAEVVGASPSRVLDPGVAHTSAPELHPGTHPPWRPLPGGLVAGVRPAISLRGEPSDLVSPHVSLERTWSLGALAGRFIELTAAGDGVSLTATTALVHEAQTRGEPTAWIAVGSTTFYPPDLAAHGVDLGALPVVRVATNTDAARAADILVRSGSFGVVVLDLSQAVTATFPTGSQTRLTGLAKKHRTVLLALTRRNGGGRADRRSAAEGLGSLISLRGEGARVRSGFDRFTWTLQAVKDKRHGPGWTHTGTCRGPAGLC